MDIRVTITTILPNEHWGFSDLLNGRELNEDTIDEIKELILEDTSDLCLPENWKIEEAKDYKTEVHTTWNIQ